MSLSIDKSHSALDHVGRMPVTIAICNLKGGCGKSTVALNLASALASEARQVCLVDADAQGTAAYCAEGGLLPVEYVSLVLGKDVQGWIRRVLALRADIALIDAPPHAGDATEAIIGLADLVLVPCTPSTADILAAVKTIELVRAARLHRTDRGPQCVLVPSKVDRRTASGREIEAALSQFGEPVGPVIRQLSGFVDAFTMRQWIGNYAPNSPAHEDIANLASYVKQTLDKTTIDKRSRKHG